MHNVVLGYATCTKPNPVPLDQHTNLDIQMYIQNVCNLQHIIQYDTSFVYIVYETDYLIPCNQSLTRELEIKVVTLYSV